ncbi:hypothetical protein PMAYCL1PPCAC_19205 [Pristionchus mayeri]|uniref:G protein-coupled receptor n=1 Tax=Pristionchus mayeri TaxID=1317129 RepID=A0AAN5CR18_9BILA|nr:hypothetical protein PMAYCL1PPCAC_19205 [Pristionchus mayeri]
MVILSTIFGAHISWLAVIITFVRLRQLGTKSVEPTVKFMIKLCCISFVVIAVVSIPQFISVEITWIDVNATCDDEEIKQYSIPTLKESDLVYLNDCLLFRIIYISSGLLFNLLPCVLLTVLSGMLAFRLHKIHQRHSEMVISRSSTSSSESANLRD